MDWPARLAAWGALLFLLGALTGGYAASAMAGWVPADVHMALGSHVNGLLGALWLAGLGWSLGFAQLSDGQVRVMAVSAIVAAYANWFITGLKALWGVHGVVFGGGTANDLVAVGLHVFVVLPTLVSAALWAWGLRHHLRG